MYIQTMNAWRTVEKRTMNARKTDYERTKNQLTINAYKKGRWTHTTCSYGERTLTDAKWTRNQTRTQRNTKGTLRKRLLTAVNANGTWTFYYCYCISAGQVLYHWYIPGTGIYTWYRTCNIKGMTSLVWYIYIYIHNLNKYTHKWRPFGGDLNK